MRTNGSWRCRAGWALISILLGCRVALAQEEAAQGPATQTGKPMVFLDKSPRIVAYQLARLSNAQLLLVERDPSHPKYIPVYEAILARPGLKLEYRKDALEALARLNRTDMPTEILAALKRLTGDNAAPVVAELSRLLAAQKVEELQKHQADLERLAEEGAQPAQREAAFAALAAFEPADALWKLAEAKNALAHLLNGLPLLPDGSRRAAFMPKVRPLLKPGGDAAVLRGAVAAAGATPGHERETFNALAKLFLAGVERPAIVRALLGMPQDKWPADQLQPLAEAIVVFARQVPEAQRTENEYLDTTQLGKSLAALLPKEDGARIRKALAGLGVNVLRLRTIYEQMLFDKTLMVAEAGKPVEIIFENPDAMPHNLVIVAPGSAEEVGPMSEQMPPLADRQGRLYVPDSPKVLFATKLLNQGERLILRFTAPSQPDDYPYLCTFPGHWQRMRGTLRVVGNLEDYLAQNPAEPATPTLTEWKLADLLPALAGLPRANTAKGRELFSGVGCVACHRVGDLGVEYGPNLTTVFAKYKNDAQAVLGEMLDPSKNIEPRYRPYNFKIAGDDPITGLLVKEEGDLVMIQTGPGEAGIAKYSKKSVAAREPQPLSLMPAGLLNLLSREQIIDLLGFLQSGGQTLAHQHKH